MTVAALGSPHFEVRLTLLLTVEGGRARGISTGYMPNVWLSDESEPMLASAYIELLDAHELEPGGTAAARLIPFFPELWTGVELGAELTVTEGPERQVARAVVTRVVSPAMSAA